jgi:16S rRNA A1518/A1519 N6-dimethyltransferase RsmA/KsgA/DIM1 with predicted DNA glycosylase/AP lyase activity
VIERAEIQPGERILEPSAGSAALAKPARDAGAEVTCVEISPASRMSWAFSMASRT